MTLVIDAAPLTYAMAAIQLIVVPANTRHRLHTTNSVQVMTITPQPTERRLDDPSELA